MDLNLFKVINRAVDKLLAGMLTIAFCVLKLVGVIHWSWWWVLSPAYLFPLTIFIVELLVWIFKIKMSNNRKEKSC